MRLGADEPSTRLLDTGLRYLSHALAAAGQAPPTVFAAHLSRREPGPVGRPGGPGRARAVDGGGRRPGVAAAGRPRCRWPDLNEAGEGAALFPGLVTIGTDGTGRVLVDLEAAQGLIAVTGPAPMVTAALSAMAMELATNRWSDRMQLTLVGFGPELAVLAPDRVHGGDSLDEALPALEARAAAAAGTHGGVRGHRAARRADPPMIRTPGRRTT